MLVGSSYTHPYWCKLSSSRVTKSLFSYSLFIVTLKTIGVLEPKLTFFLLLSFSVEVEEGLEDAFLEFLVAETLLKKYLTV